MPVYNCRKCNGNVDPTDQVSCPACKEPKPLSCSKCNESINHHDIFAIEKLRTKRTLLCKSCGTDNEVVKCPICRLSQVRSQGVTVSQVEGAPVYHKACLEKRREAIKYANTAAPASAVGITLIGFLIMNKASYALPACLVLSLVLFMGIKAVKNYFEPR